MREEAFVQVLNNITSGKTSGKIILKNSEITDKQAVRIAEVVAKAKGITYLDLSQNKIGNKGGAALMALPDITVNLTGNLIDDPELCRKLTGKSTTSTTTISSQENTQMQTISPTFIEEISSEVQTNSALNNSKLDKKTFTTGNFSDENLAIASVENIQKINLGCFLKENELLLNDQNIQELERKTAANKTAMVVAHNVLGNRASVVKIDDRDNEKAKKYGANEKWRHVPGLGADFGVTAEIKDRVCQFVKDKNKQRVNEFLTKLQNSVAQDLSTLIKSAEEFCGEMEHIITSILIGQSKTNVFLVKDKLFAKLTGFIQEITKEINANAAFYKKTREIARVNDPIKLGQHVMLQEIDPNVVCIADLEEQIANVNGKLSVNNNRKASLESLNAQYEQAENRLDVLEIEIKQTTEQLSSKEKSVQQAQSEVDALSKEIELLKTQKADADLHKSEGTEQLAKYTKLNADYTRQGVQFKEKETNLSNVKEQCHKFAEQLKNLMAEQQEIIIKKRDLRPKISATKAELDKITNDIVLLAEKERELKEHLSIYTKQPGYEKLAKVKEWLVTYNSRMEKLSILAAKMQQILEQFEQGVLAEQSSDNEEAIQFLLWQNSIALTVLISSRGETFQKLIENAKLVEKNPEKYTPEDLKELIATIMHEVKQADTLLQYSNNKYLLYQDTITKHNINETNLKDSKYEKSCILEIYKTYEEQKKLLTKIIADLNEWHQKLKIFTEAEKIKELQAQRSKFLSEQKQDLQKQRDEFAKKLEDKTIKIKTELDASAKFVDEAKVKLSNVSTELKKQQEQIAKLKLECDAKTIAVTEVVQNSQTQITAQGIMENKKLKLKELLEQKTKTDEQLSECTKALSNVLAKLKPLETKLAEKKELSGVEQAEHVDLANAKTLAVKKEEGAKHITMEITKSAGGLELEIKQLEEQLFKLNADKRTKEQCDSELKSVTEQLNALEITEKELIVKQEQLNTEYKKYNEQLIANKSNYEQKIEADKKEQQLFAGQLDYNLLLAELKDYRNSYCLFYQDQNGKHTYAKEVINCSNYIQQYKLVSRLGLEVSNYIIEVVLKNIAEQIAKILTAQLSQRSDRITKLTQAIKILQDEICKEEMSRAKACSSKATQENITQPEINRLKLELDSLNKKIRDIVRDQEKSAAEREELQQQRTKIIKQIILLRKTVNTIVLPDKTQFLKLSEKRVKLAKLEEQLVWAKELPIISTVILPLSYAVGFSTEPWFKKLLEDLQNKETITIPGPQDLQDAQQLNKLLIMLPSSKLKDLINYFSTLLTLTDLKAFENQLITRTKILQSLQTRFDAIKTKFPECVEIAAKKELAQELQAEQKILATDQSEVNKLKNVNFPILKQVLAFNNVALVNVRMLLANRLAHNFFSKYQRVKFSILHNEVVVLNQEFELIKLTEQDCKEASLVYSFKEKEAFNFKILELIRSPREHLEDLLLKREKLQLLHKRCKEMIRERQLLLQELKSWVEKFKGFQFEEFQQYLVEICKICVQLSNDVGPFSPKIHEGKFTKDDHALHTLLFKIDSNCALNKLQLNLYLSSDILMQLINILRKEAKQVTTVPQEAKQASTAQQVQSLFKQIQAVEQTISSVLSSIPWSASRLGEAMVIENNSYLPEELSKLQRLNTAILELKQQISKISLVNKELPSNSTSAQYQYPITLYTRSLQEKELELALSSQNANVSYIETVIKSAAQNETEEIAQEFAEHMQEATRKCNDAISKYMAEKQYKLEQEREEKKRRFQQRKLLYQQVMEEEKALSLMQAASDVKLKQLSAIAEEQRKTQDEFEHTYPQEIKDRSRGPSNGLILNLPLIH